MDDEAPQPPKSSELWHSCFLKRTIVVVVAAVVVVVVAAVVVVDA